MTGPEPCDLLDENQRRQVAEARQLLASRDGDETYWGQITARALAAALRGTLELLDQVAPEPKGGEPQ